MLAALLALRTSLSASLVLPLPASEREAMVGRSWRAGCPVGLDDLRMVLVAHWDEQGRLRRGRLVVHREHAEAVGRVFERLHALRFVVPSVRPAWEFDGDDAAMMRANNTSAFNCRTIGGGSTWSEHAWGRALDLNPLWNPYVRGERVDPPEGRAFLARDPERPGTIVAEGSVVRAFAEIGWGWGGNWRSGQDFQHFSANGR